MEFPDEVTYSARKLQQQHHEHEHEHEHDEVKNENEDQQQQQQQQQRQQPPYAMKQGGRRMSASRLRPRFHSRPANNAPEHADPSPEGRIVHPLHSPPDEHLDGLDVNKYDHDDDQNGAKRRRRRRRRRRCYNCVWWLLYCPCRCQCWLLLVCYSILVAVLLFLVGLFVPTSIISHPLVPSDCDTFAHALLPSHLVFRLRLLQEHPQQQQQQQQQEQQDLDLLGQEYVKRWQVACVCSEGVGQSSFSLYVLNFDVCANPYRLMTTTTTTTTNADASAAAAAQWHFARLMTAQRKVRSVLVATDARDMTREAVRALLDSAMPTTPLPFFEASSSPPPPTLRLIQAGLKRFFASTTDYHAEARTRADAAVEIAALTRAALLGAARHLQDLKYDNLADAIGESADVACKSEVVLGRMAAQKARGQGRGGPGGAAAYYNYDDDEMISLALGGLQDGDGHGQLALVDRQQLFWIACYEGRETTIAVQDEHFAVGIEFGRVSRMVDKLALIMADIGYSAHKDGDGLSKGEWLEFVKEMVLVLEKLKDINKRFWLG